jgi:hypothetical protein
MRKNIPKGAIVDLQQALKGALREDQQKQWLGNAATNSGTSLSAQHPWKYVYFTEDDHILNAHNNLLATSVLDDGGILIPHRLQPIPHPLDLKGILDHPNTTMLPASFGNGTVEDLYATTDSCCDMNEKPGEQMGGGCAKPYWWLCGFETEEQNHTRLESYQFLRLIEGTDIVSLAATEHGRKCSPMANDRGCRRRQGS